MVKKIENEVKEFLEATIDGISNAGIERIIISEIFRDPELLYEVKEQLNVDDFNNTINRNIVSIMYEIEEQTKSKGVSKISPSLIKTWADKVGIDVGGEEYLKILSQSKVDEDENIQFYIKELKNLSIRRKGAKAALEVIEDSLNVKSEDYDTFISRQEQKFSNILVSTKGFDDIVDISEDIDEILFERSISPKDLLGVPTGFDEFDKQFGGLAPGTLTTVCAFAKTGKSALLTNWAVNIAYKEKIPVLYIDTEMKKEEFFDRVVSIITAKQGVIVPESAISTGRFARYDRAVEAIEKTKQIMKSGKLMHLYMPEFTIEKVLNIARRFKRKYGVEYNGYENQVLIIFDYIKLPDDSDLRAAKEYQQLGYFTNGLKNKLAGKEGIPVLTAAQLNRSGSDAEENDATQLAGSLRILQYSNTLAYLRNKRATELENDGGWEIAGNQVLSLNENSTRRGGLYKGWIKNYKPKGVVLMEEIRNISLE